MAEKLKKFGEFIKPEPINEPIEKESPEVVNEPIRPISEPVFNKEIDES